jgi:membrane dipeptidase
MKDLIPSKLMHSPTTSSIHYSAIVIDGHADTPQRFLDEGWGFTDALGSGMLNLDAARRGNLAAEFFALWVDPAEHPAGTHYNRACALAEAVLRQVREHPHDLQLCLSPSDILAAHSEGRFGMLLSVEGGHAIEDSLEKLRHFYSLGVRSMTLTWNNSNNWADSSAETARHDGLTEFGREVIREMNRLGMMIDVSHVSDETFWQVLERSTAPIVATHSCARALCASSRNLSDEQLRALASRGGLCMVNFFPAFLSDEWRHAWNNLQPERQLLHQRAAAPFRALDKPVPYGVSSAIDREIAARIPPVPFATLIDHFDHIIRIAGIDHVGLGSDFDGVPALPRGLRSAADLPAVTAALHARGYAAEGLHKLLGGNFLRLFDAVQQSAASS